MCLGRDGTRAETGGHVDDLENRGMFADTELVDKFAALFADAERTEVHGTEYLQDLFWEHGTDIHGRCAHGCVTEGTERGSMADAAPCQREYGDRKMRSLHGGQKGCYWWN